jgi:hypothetical protein
VESEHKYLNCGNRGPHALVDDYGLECQWPSKEVKSPHGGLPGTALFATTDPSAGELLVTFGSRPREAGGGCDRAILRMHTCACTDAAV